MTIEQQALELIRELRDDGCMAMHPNPQGSDYHCRYCDSPTKSHSDLTIVHHELCVWPRIAGLEKEEPAKPELSPYEQGCQQAWDMSPCNPPYQFGTSEYREFERGWKTEWNRE